MVEDTPSSGKPTLDGPIDYESMAETFNMALIYTLRKHSVADTFLDYWVPDADPVLGIAGMVDSARISGIRQIDIRFRKTTLGEDHLPALRKALAGLCTLTFTDEGASFLLHAHNMNRSAVRQRAEGGEREKPEYWQADRLKDERHFGEAVADWDTTELPEFADIRPEFRAALKARLAAIAHEGGLGSIKDGQTQVQGSEDGVTLELAVDPEKHIVGAARHIGGRTPGERAVLDIFCEISAGLPIQEVADHINLRTLDRLVDDDRTPPVPGVLMPVNAGAPFILAGRLARRAYDRYCADVVLDQGTNFYYAPPQGTWQALSSDDRRARIEDGLRAFLQSAGLYPDDMQILRVEKNKYGYEVRVVVSFSDRIADADKPRHMRGLEQKLRRDLESELELIADRAKDSSPLRRLS